MKILAATGGSKPALQGVRYAIKLLRSIPSSANSIALDSAHDDAGLRHATALVGKDVVLAAQRVDARSAVSAS